MNFWQKLNKPIIGLAPMDGVTDFACREIYAEIAKPDVIFTEFVNAEGLVRGGKKLLKSLRFSQKQRPIVAQLFGDEAESFKKAVKIIEKLGFDGIDINMGCPARKVVLRKSGGALIGNFSLSKQIILSCLESTTLPVSVKTRISDDKWYEFLSDFNLAAVTIHGRFLKSGLSGDVDWREVGKAANIMKKKFIVLGNGGILNRDDGILKCKTFGLDGVLIGRGALGNPWVFGNEKADKTLVLKTIEKHAKIGDYPSVLKHFGWYAKGFEGAKDLRLKLLKTKNFTETKKVLEDYYD